MTEILLRGLDGSNPLGFLAALGTLRLCDLTWPGGRVKMRWVNDGGWRPVLAGVPAESESDLCSRLAEGGRWAPLEAFAGLGNNLTVSARLFGEVVSKVAAITTKQDHTAADFAAAFGNEVFDEPDKDRISYTDLSFITGSGHQHFLGTARALQECAGVDHLREALFGPWRFADKGNSFRWDPDDAKEYALRWRDPSSGGVSAVWGANRLAFEALAFFPMVPTPAGVKTTGFNRVRGGAHEFTWPIWSHDAGADTVRSLLSIKQLQESAPNRQQLQSIGIAEVFRAQRVRIGQGANFKVSFRPARAV